METLPAASLVILTLIFVWNFLLKGNTASLSIVKAWRFCSKRYDFMWDAFRQNGMRTFDFRVMNHRVVALFGEEGRKVFFNNQYLDLGEGYQFFQGGAPSLKDEIPDPEQVTELSKRIQLLLRKERVEGVLPSLYDDIRRAMDNWGNKGTFNPFNELYALVFQMTVRLASCHELANDPEAVARIAHHYRVFEKSATPAALLMPWFPSPARKNKRKSSVELYNTFNSYVDIRRKTEKPQEDAIDLLIACGDSNDRIVQVLLSIIFAGVINTGINVCWNLLYLGFYPEWKEKVVQEFTNFLTTHTDSSSPDPLHKRLCTIPIGAWEEELPLVDSVIRETLRLTMSLTAVRRNKGKTIEVGDTIVRRGDFLVYSMDDVHLDSGVYSDPLIFDPGRYSESRREDRKVPLGFLAWGAGRHPCTGMRVAQLEMKIIMAIFLLGYSYELVDKSGNPPTVLPQPDRNDIQEARPLGEHCFLKFERLVE